MTDLPKPPEHPELDGAELARQRGDTPPEPVGTTTPPPTEPDLDPAFIPDPSRRDKWRGMLAEIGREHRPRREDVLPYLLIRAFSPGDRGQRPLWPPTVCWESPDLMLIDATYTGPFDIGRLVVAPTAGRTYRVFVRIWNLGLLPAVGVHVRAWIAALGFFGSGNQNDPYYQKHQIGGAWVDLADRTRLGCTSVVELDAPWQIEPAESGHQCLIASVSCPADHFDGPLLVNDHRHVGQRNLSIMPSKNASALLSDLVELVPEGFTLALTHGGPAVAPLLQAVAPRGLLVGDHRRRVPILAPALNELRRGVVVGSSLHLLTAFRENSRSIVVRSDRLAKYVLRSRFGQPLMRDAADPFATGGDTRRLLDKLGPQRWPLIADVSDLPLETAFAKGMFELLDSDRVDSKAITAALGGPAGAQHLLRLTLTMPAGDLVGGYSIVV